MATSEMQKQEKSRSRLLIVTAVVMLLIACGVFGSLFYLQHQSSSSGEAIAERKIAIEQAALESTDAVATKRLEYLKLIRGKWRPWALKHKQELKRMLNAKSDDRSALDAVHNAMPATPQVADAGFTFKELGAPAPDVEFSWQPSGKLEAPRAGDTKALAEYKEHQQFRTKRRQENFAALRDYELSRSLNAGRTHIILWASGRITESKFVKNPNDSPGVSSLIEAPPREIEPPYDFLS